MKAEIKRYKGRYTGPQIDDLLGRVPKVEQRVTSLESGAASSDKHYELHCALSKTWNIEHNLGKRPSVTITNEDREEIFADVFHTSINALVVVFGSAQSGYIILN